MINQQAVKADFKLIVREPILLFMMTAPVYILVVLKVFLTFAVPYIHETTGFDLTEYYGYVLAMTLLMMSGILGSAFGFLMIDDRDARILDLMSVTPMGYLGYIIMRITIPFTGSVLYTIAGYYILNIYPLYPGKLLFAAILNGAAGMLVGLLLFVYAEDKVKGITYSKGFNLINFLALADLFNLKWLTALASLIPFYWIVRLITTPGNIDTYLIAVFVHLFWLTVFFKRAARSSL